MLTGPMRRFCEGIIAGKNGVNAYLAAYPRSSRKAGEVGASRLLRNAKIREEIARLRSEADRMAGSAVLALLEKRMFLARLVRTKLGAEDVDPDLLQSVKKTKYGVAIRIADKLAAIKLDCELAGHWREAGANDRLAELLSRIRK